MRGEEYEEEGDGDDEVEKRRWDGSHCGLYRL